MKKLYVPSNTRLLHGVRSRLSDLVEKSDDKELQWAAEAIDITLNELMLRENRGFFVSLYADLHATLVEGERLLKQHSVDIASRYALETLPVGIDESMNFSLLSEHVNEALQYGEKLIDSASTVASSNVAMWIARLSRVERELHAYRAKQAERPASGSEKRLTPPNQNELQQYLIEKFPEQEDIKVTAFRPLVGGFQKYTILFDTEDSVMGKRSCVMRAERNERFVDLDAGDVVSEFQMVSLLHEAGVAVAKPLWLESDENKLGRRFIVSDKVDGENYGSAVSMDTVLSDQALHSLIEALASIHQVPITEAISNSVVGHWLNYPSLAENTRASVEAFNKQPYTDSVNPSPIMRRLYLWLLDNIPEDDCPPCLLHVDYGPHNILMRDDNVAAVLDWESVRIGDPVEDVSYFINMMRHVDPEKSLAIYENITGTKINEYRLRYFDVFNLMKVLNSFVSTAAMYEAEPEAPVEWCIIGLPYTQPYVDIVEEKIALAEQAKL